MTVMRTERHVPTKTMSEKESLRKRDKTERKRGGSGDDYLDEMLSGSSLGRQASQ